jgi:hypothetical protein
MFIFFNWGPWEFTETFDIVTKHERQDGLYLVFTDVKTKTYEIYKRVNEKTKEVQYKSVLRKTTVTTESRATLKY